MSRQDQWLIGVSIEVTPGKVEKIPDPWDTIGGGDADSSELKYKAGGMVPEVSLGGTPTVANVTVSRLYDYDRDHDLARRLANRVGRAKIHVRKRPLDPDGVPKGESQTYTGILKKVNYPDANSTSSSANMLELEVSTHGKIS